MRSATPIAFCKYFLALTNRCKLPSEILVSAVNGVIVNKNAPHSVESCGTVKLSILVEPTSGFASELTSKIQGNYLIFDKEGIAELQTEAKKLLTATDKRQYAEFVDNFAEYLGVCKRTKILDERINKVLELLQNCDC